MDKLDLYRCETCGNIVEVLHCGEGELVCCGKPMSLLTPKRDEDAMLEKHVPIFLNIDKNTEIRVGEVLHPMTEEHYIEFIQVISEDKKYASIKFLKPFEEPKMSVNENTKYKTAREYCNIHGLWEGYND